jgi:hypothetical protein
MESGHIRIKSKGKKKIQGKKLKIKMKMKKNKINCFTIHMNREVAGKTQIFSVLVNN